MSLCGKKSKIVLTLRPQLCASKMLFHKLGELVHLFSYYANHYLSLQQKQMGN